jgi:hypothetical protein
MKMLTIDMSFMLSPLKIDWSQISKSKPLTILDLAGPPLLQDAGTCHERFSFFPSDIAQRTNVPTDILFQLIPGVGRHRTLLPSSGPWPQIRAFGTLSETFCSSTRAPYSCCSNVPVSPSHCFKLSKNGMYHIV